MTPVVQLLLEHYGFRGVLLIMSALVLNICVGGSLVQPLKWHMKKPSKQDPVSQPLMTTPESSVIFQKSKFLRGVCFEHCNRLCQSICVTLPTSIGP